MLINFPRTYRDHIPGGLSLDKPNADGLVTMSGALPVLSYKYLGVLFNPKLHWSLQHAKALATTTFWASQLWRVSKSASILSTTGTKQLCNTVAVPRSTYGAEVWYTYLHKPESAVKARGSIAITNKLRSVQPNWLQVVSAQWQVISWTHTLTSPNRSTLLQTVISGYTMLMLLTHRSLTLPVRPCSSPPES